MHRIDKAGTVLSIPTPGAVGSPLGYFSNLATELSADWLNSIQEELLGIIAAASLSPDKTNRAQFLASLKFLRSRYTQRSVATTNTSVATDDMLLLSDAGGSFTETLITAVGRAGYRLICRKINDSANVVTLDGNGSQTIGGQLTRTLQDINDQLILESDGANWLVRDCNFRRVVIGSAQTANGIRTNNASFGAPTNAPVVSITPEKSGIYKIFGTFTLESDGGGGSGTNVALKIVPTVGSPTVLHSQEVVAHNFAGFGAIGCGHAFVIARLVAATAYTFQVQMRNTLGGADCHLRSDLMTSGHFLTITEF